MTPPLVAPVPPQVIVEDLVQVLHHIPGDALRLSPTMRKEWRGMARRLAVALAMYGVRAP